MVERRLGSRERVRARGKVVLATGASMDITVIDLSPTGARLEVPLKDFALPKRFWLHVPRSDRIEEAEVVWRQGFEVGVCFAASKDDTVVADVGKAAAPRMSLAQLRALTPRR